MLHPSPSEHIHSQLHFFPYDVTNTSYHISPSSGEPRSEDLYLTLSQFAADTSGYLHSNTTLLLSPGNHSLNMRLSITNTNNFLRNSNFSNDLNTVIVCTDSHARFSFTIEDCSRLGLKFLGACGGNKVESVTDFRLEDTCFECQADHRGTAIELVNSTITIKRSFFVSWITMEVIKDSLEQIISDTIMHGLVVLS